MKKVTWKRTMAYLIDIILIYLVVSMFSNIEAINPTFEEYDKATSEYVELYEDYMSAATKNASGLEELATEVTNKSYDVARYGYTITIMGLIVSALYFIVFEFYNKGQTIGKKLMKIKVVNDNNERPSFVQCLIRSSIKYNILLGSSILLGIACLILLLVGSKSAYFEYSAWIQSVDFSIAAVSLILIMFRKDGKGLNDMLAHTSVISAVKEKDEIKEANYTEKETEKEDKKKVK